MLLLARYCCTRRACSSWLARGSCCMCGVCRPLEGVTINPIRQSDTSVIPYASRRSERHEFRLTNSSPGQQRMKCCWRGRISIYSVLISRWKQILTYLTRSGCNFSLDEDARIDIDTALPRHTCHLPLTATLPNITQSRNASIVQPWQCHWYCGSLGIHLSQSSALGIKQWDGNQRN